MKGMKEALVALTLTTGKHHNSGGQRVRNDTKSTKYHKEAKYTFM